MMERKLEILFSRFCFIQSLGASSLLICVRQRSHLLSRLIQVSTNLLYRPIIIIAKSNIG